MDTWLRQSLERTTRTWIPDSTELAYFVQRLIGLLLVRRTWCRPHETATVHSICEPSPEWRWHSLLGGYSLASSLLFRTGLSLGKFCTIESSPLIKLIVSDIIIVIDRPNASHGHSAVRIMMKRRKQCRQNDNVC